MEEKTKQNVGINYEIKMYQLLIIFLIGIFASLGVGLWLGETLGYSEGIDAVTVTTPDYCYAQNQGHKNITIECMELENVTLADLCKTLSTPLEHKVKILITG